MTMLKTILFTLFVPGTVVGLFPYLLVSKGLGLPGIDRGITKYSGAIPVVLGVLFYFASAFNFVVKGKGTPAPVDPPLELVTSGPYRVVRNPMYVGGILILLGESLIFQSPVLLLYLLFIFMIFHLFIIFYEEPHLRKIFGATYEKYCSEVPRWIPDFPGLFRKQVKPGL